MLAIKNKFNREDFDKIKKQRTKRVVCSIGFFVIPERSGKIGKKSIVVSKKVCKTAVERNFYKRLFYNIMSDINKNNSRLAPASFILFLSKKFSKETLLSEIEKIKITCSQQ